MAQINLENPPKEDFQVFVGNLTVRISDELLLVKFHPYGKIVKMDRKGQGDEKYEIPSKKCKQVV
jgi:hypothetical protein